MRRYIESFQRQKLPVEDAKFGKAILQKTFPGKLKEFITTRPALQEKPKGVLPVKNKRQKYIKDINA